MDEVKVLKTAISNEILADILRANQRTTNFISEKLESPKEIVKEDTTTTDNLEKTQTTIVSNPIPDKQQKFVKIINNAKARMPDAKNEMAMGAILNDRSKQICALMKASSQTKNMKHHRLYKLTTAF